MDIYQWALATKSGDNLKEFLKNREDEYTLWYLISGLHPKHPAVIRWKTLREYMNEQEKLFREYEAKCYRKLLDKRYKEALRKNI
jgi:hypothetical protein